MLAGAEGHAWIDADDDVLRIIWLEPFRHHLDAAAVVQHMVVRLPAFGPVLVFHALLLPAAAFVNARKLRFHSVAQRLVVRLPVFVHLKITADLELLPRQDIL